MANNVEVQLTAGSTAFFKTTDNSGVHTPHHNVDAVIPGTSATNLGKAEDSAAGSGDTGVFTLAVRRDAEASTTADGDYHELQVNPIGRLKTAQTPRITVVPTMGSQTAGLYSENDFVNAKITLSNIVPFAGGGGEIVLVKVLSKSTQTGTYDVAFFNADPTSTTISDNGAVQINAADLTKLIGWAHCDDVTSHGTGSCHQAANVGLSFKLPSGTTAYAAVVCRFALNQGSASDMILVVDVIPD